MNKPTKPNITIPAEFASNGVRTPFSNAKIQDGFDRINPDVFAGDNLNQFIDDTYKGLNYSIAGTDAINLIQEGEVLTVNSNNELVSESADNLITGSYVNKSGDTMTGALMIEKSTPDVFFNDTSVDFENLEDVPHNKYIHFRDKNGIDTANIQSRTRSTYNDIWIRIRPIGDTTTALTSLPGINLRSDSSGNITFTFPRCTTAATTTSTASSGLVAVVVENYVNGKSWYRVWSDGWIEQGGYHGTGTSLQVALLKNFSNTNYTVINSAFKSSAGDAYASIVTAQTTAKFTIKTASGGTCNGYWYACGY